MTKSKDNAETILAGSRVIAIVGASPNPARPSYIVASYLIDKGFEVIPVRPKVKSILGLKCYGSLDEISVKVDIVDVFRKPEACPDVARAAVEAGAGALWLQEGIISEDAARIARAGGLRVVMDLCIRKVHENPLNTGF
ncbi:MAG: CoA-binding protein [Thermoleophilia bacterium]